MTENDHNEQSSDDLVRIKKYSFVDHQGPAFPYTYGVGMAYSPRKWFDIAADAGTDFHSGWYMAIVPVVRF